MHTVEGMEFWLDGAPDRTYKIVGMVRGTSEDGISILRTAVAKKARENGGDAVIIVSKNRRNSGIGFVGNYAYTTTEDEEQYYVIKYVQ